MDFMLKESLKSKIFIIGIGIQYFSLPDGISDKKKLARLL
jgi:hypothetical protein